MNTNEQPEFDSLESFIEHQRAQIPEQAAAAVARAVAEFQADGVAVPPAAAEQLAQRVRKMLSDRLDQMQISLTKQLEGTPT